MVSVGVENAQGKDLRRLLSTTFADENKHHQGRSKSIGISIKDRGSIHLLDIQDAAYWFW